MKRERSHTLVCAVIGAAGVLALGANLPAAEPPPPAFKNAAALLSVGRDDRVYLASDRYILSCRPDGSQPVAAEAGYALRNATANAAGIIAAGHAHFLKDVTLYDREFNRLGRFGAIGDSNYNAPAEIATGPSGDFYVLDQGRDRVTRFHPDGVRCGVYQIPHEPAGPDGVLTRFRVCEPTKSLYVVSGGPNLRCYALDSAEFQFTPALRWQLATPLGNLWKYGYGGLDVDDQGILYTLNLVGESFLNSYAPDGRLLKRIPLQMGEHQPVDPTRVLGLAVSHGEAFVKRQHPTELFLRFDLKTGALRNVVTLPADFTGILRPTGTAAGGTPIPAVRSRVGLPPNRRNVRRVLFVGNSQVNCVRDIPEMIEDLSRATTDPAGPLIVTDEVVIGGVGLQGYWKDDLARKRIAAGGWDYVVINELVYSFGSTTERFLEYAAKFNAAIRHAGATPVIFATADVDKHREEHTRMYQDALTFARRNHCRVAGAGLAWLKAWQQQPALDLHFTDRAHPNALGYYLNALVLYATLTDSNPAVQHLPLCDAAQPDQAPLLQTIAWQQYQEDRHNEQ